MVRLSKILFQQQNVMIVFLRFAAVAQALKLKSIYLLVIPRISYKVVKMVIRFN